MTHDAPPLPRLDLGLADLAADFDVILCDVWGVIHNGVYHDRAAVEALRRFRQGGGTIVLVTNAPAPKAGVLRRLTALDVPPDAYDDIATSGEVTIDLIVAAGCPPLFSIAPKSEIALYAEAGRRGPHPPPLVDADAADLIVCIGPEDAHAPPETYDPVLGRLQSRGLDLICANPDIVVENGPRLEVCAGAIAARYAAMGGTVVQAGKPFPAIYERAIAMAQARRGEVPRDRILAIGDAIHTDMEGARSQGLASLFITGGIHRATLHPRGADAAVDEDALARLFSDGGARPLAALPTLRWTQRA